jgi:hypothetical protein
MGFYFLGQNSGDHKGRAAIMPVLPALTDK